MGESVGGIKNQIGDTMAKNVRHKDKQYPGVYYVEIKNSKDKVKDKIFYVRYRLDGKSIEEKAGYEKRDNFSFAKANLFRDEGINRKRKPNSVIREEKKELNNKWTISKLWEEYLSQNSNLKRIGTDKGIFNNYLDKKFGNKQPSEIISMEVDRLRISLLKKLKPATVWAILELLKRIGNFGAKRNLCAGINCYIKMPKVDNEKTEDLSDEQLSSLLKAIEKDTSIQAKNFMKLILYSGLRRGELFKLRWEDINFKKNYIFIRNPKGGKSQKIPLNSNAKDLLLNHERPYKNSPFVFPGKNGNQRTDIKYQINRIKKRAKLPKEFRPLHGLRHFYASMLASSGKVDMYQLQKLLTHKSPQMTQRYAHLRDEALNKASEVGVGIMDKIGKDLIKKIK